MKNRMQQDNKGWSLVELMIVVAIMSILLGIVGFGFRMVSGKPAEECARKLTSVLQSGRTTAQGKYEVVCQISEDAITGEIILTTKIYKTYADAMANVFTEDTEIIGRKEVTVQYSLDDGTSYSIDTTPLELTYERATGGFRRVTPTGSCNQITVSKASTVRTIELVPPTGRVALH